MQRIVALACAAVTLVCAGEKWVWAQTEPATETTPYAPCTEKADEAALQAARGAFEAGKAAFNESDFPRAILYWEDAYHRDCSAHLMLKNLARAYEGNQQFEQAALALTTFLERVPDAEDRAQVEADIKKLRERKKPPVEPERVTLPPGPPAKQELPSPASPRPVEGPASPTDLAASDAQLAPEEEGGSSNLGPVLLVATGAAITLTSGLLWAKARSDETRAQDSCPTRKLCSPEVEQAGNDAIDRQKLWTIVGAGGAAILVGGVLWYVLKPSKTSHTAVQPLVAPRFAGLQLTGAF